MMITRMKLFVQEAYYVTFRKRKVNYYILHPYKDGWIKYKKRGQRRNIVTGTSYSCSLLTRIKMENISSAIVVTKKKWREKKEEKLIFLSF